MRIAYLGTSDFAVTVLRALAANGHAPVLVVAPPDRRKGRGRELSAPPAADAARELGIELHQTPKLNDPGSIAAIAAAAPEALVVCAFGQLIGEELLAAHEILNVHPSLIPRWRGAAPIERAIMAGDERTGMTIMGLTAGLDSGPVCLQEPVPIGDHEYFGELELRLALLGGALMSRALELLGTGELAFAEQDEDAVTYAEKIAPEDRLLDPWAEDAAALERRVRALNPHVGTHLELATGERLKVNAATARPVGPATATLELDEQLLVLGALEGGLVLERVQPPGGRQMPSSEYLRGNPLPALRSADG